MRSKRPKHLKEPLEEYEKVYLENKKKCRKYYNLIKNKKNLNAQNTFNKIMGFDDERN